MGDVIKTMKGIRVRRFFLSIAMVMIVVAGLFLSRFLSPQIDMGVGDRHERMPLASAETVEDTGGASFNDGVVAAWGVRRISSKSAVSRELVRRAALSDARRNLLTEARRIKEGITRKASISGHVGYHWIVSERRDGYLYRVMIAARLADIRVDWQ